ncbi:hypothetical protein PILCRDRAFT_825164 [Piloderma croceum F 1598]|uniref:Uncharacterized protein n=1 Tax=Piloderma croceum (strain F 1598) TaxID=765440 RepID=A0A0C3EYW5_PILCF|nr:hypothetical protein PILCRDRAFT_825164 [Piloderma croceum F 1598]
MAFLNAIKFIYELATAVANLIFLQALYYCACLLGSNPPSSPPIRPERLLHPPPDFERCIRLQDVLKKIQQHILESVRTRQRYAHVCGLIEEELPSQAKINSADVSVNDVEVHFSSHWPRFVPLCPSYMKYKDEVRWGRVDKDCNAPNNIELNPDLVRAVEDAPDHSDLLIYLMLILIVTIFHELMHHLTKYTFGVRLTPPGIGTAFNGGEAGPELERLLFGGIVSVVWNKEEVGEMEEVRCVVLEYLGDVRDLPTDKCQLLIDSITTPQLAKFRIGELKGHIFKKGTERHRLTGPIPHTSPYVLPSGMVISTRYRGLGIKDLNVIVADDKHIT